jgi:APA family basic amino acid/polyamine antiporter
MAEGSADTQVEQEIGEELDRNIGLLGALAIGIGTMIAAGIFVLSGLAVANVGTVAIVSFVLAALVAALTAAAYAEFSSIYLESGGGYMYVAETFDTDLVYIMGWTMIVGYPASAAFYLASFSDWFYRFIYPVLGIPQWVPYWIPGIAVLGLLVFINSRGSEESSQFQIVVTTAKLILLVVFLYGGLQAFNTDVVTTSFAQNIGNVAQIGATSALVFITFIGFSAIATNADEIKDPGTTIPRALYLSMVIVIVFYVLVVLVIVVAINDQQFLNFLASNVQLGGLSPTQYVAQNGEVSMAYAAQYYLGSIGFYVIIVGALFSMLSAANATILAGSRVKLALARRNHLPDQFEDLHPDYGTPYKSVLLTGGFIFAFIFVFTVLFGEVPGAVAVSPLFSQPLFGLHLGLGGVTEVANLLLLAGFSVVNVAIVVSRRKFSDLDRGFEVPFVPVVPAIAVVANIGLIISLGRTTIVLGLIAEAVGVVFWFAWKGRTPSAEEMERETPTAVAEHNPSGRERDYQIVVPIANPDNAEQLMSTATDIAADRNGEVLVLSVVDLPEQTPLAAGQQYTEEKREVLNRAMALADGGERSEASRTSEDERSESSGSEPNTERRASSDEQSESDGGDVPVSGTIRISHQIDRAILNTVEQYNSDALLMGWGGWRARRREVVLGSIVDTVVTEADCDVLVERIDPETATTVESILLPTAGGPHAELAGEVARAITRSTGAHVELLRVVAPDDDRDDAEETVEDALADFEDIDVEATVVENGDVVDAITERSADHDLTIIGATREGLFQRIIFGAIPERVGEAAESTVILTKRNLDITSRLRRLFERR